jgi:3-deoxy-D-manno-octulosonic-acid transferase
MIWLCATGPSAIEPLRVLEDSLQENRIAPRCRQILATTPEDDAAILADLDKNAPDLLVLCGPRVPPALLAAARIRGTGLFLVDATGVAVSGMLRFVPGFTRSILDSFDEIHVRDQGALRAVRRVMGDSPKVHLSGPLARHGSAPGCNAFELTSLHAAMAQRPVWLGYSLPAAEEDAVLLAHAHALRRAHRLLLIAMPRDAARGANLAERARDIGFVCSRRALDEDITETTQVYIADTEDAPGLFLRLAPVGFLGGSLTRDAGSPALVLAAALGTAMVFGRHALTGADGPFAALLRAGGGGRLISAAPELGEAISALLAPDVGAQAALAAWELATEGSDTTATLARSLCDWLQLNLPAPGSTG